MGELSGHRSHPESLNAGSLPCYDHGMTHVGEMPQARPARRKEIVDAARAIAAESGWPAVTVRAIGSRIGCSAPAIYQYFRDKDAVLAALAAEGRAGLAAALDDAVADMHGPAKKLRAVVAALWRFALANRELYAVMFGLDGLNAHRHPGMAGPTPDLLVRVAAELVAKRQSPVSAEDFADSIAATVHGFLSLTLGGEFPGGHDRASSLLSDTVEALIRSLEKR